MDAEQFMNSIKMYHFIQNLRKQANEFDGIAYGESLRASGGWFGKAEAYREIADRLEKEFIRG